LNIISPYHFNSNCKIYTNVSPYSMELFKFQEVIQTNLKINNKIIVIIDVSKSNLNNLHLILSDLKVKNIYECQFFLFSDDIKEYHFLTEIENDIKDQNNTFFGKGTNFSKVADLLKQEFYIEKREIYLYSDLELTNQDKNKLEEIIKKNDKLKIINVL